MRLFRAFRHASAVPRETGVDGGPVIVLAGGRSDADVLEWATAEAAARGSELRIVHAFRWPRVMDSAGLLTVDLQARATAEDVVGAAVARARGIAPSLRITSDVVTGRVASALVSEAGREGQALVVVGQGGSQEESLIRRLVRRTTASVAVIRLSHHQQAGPSAGRVVVGVDHHHPGPALGFAFRAARRRGTGVTIVHSRLSSVGWNDIAETVALCSLAYRDVDVRRHASEGLLASTVLTESASAALTVLGPSYVDLLHRARGPVVRVGSD